VLLLSACADDKKYAPQEGRITISEVRDVDSKTSSSASIQLGQGIQITHWGQAEYDSTNNKPDSAGNFTGTKVWDTSIGSGLDDDAFSIASPVVYDGVAYTLGTGLKLTAVSMKDGKRLWQKKLDSVVCSVKSIGLAVSQNAIFAVTGFGDVYALDHSGTILWKKELKTNLRSAPALYQNALAILSVTNQLYVMDTQTGSVKWTYQSLENETNILGMGRPAIDQNLLIAAFSSGEVTAFDVKTGLIKWSNFLSGGRTFNSLTETMHISASPVIEGGNVYVTSASKKLAAYTLRSGTPVLSKTVGSDETPVVSGNAIFMINTQNELVAMDKKTGALFWSAALETEKKERWLSPFITGDKIMTVSTQGKVIQFDVHGKIARRFTIEKAAVAPFMIQNNLIVLTTNGDLVLYK
jgi:outer membrane protein assembly factor BamB